MKMTVRLNGTSKNPYDKFGFTSNPFPQLPHAEIMAQVMRVQELAGKPIPDTNYIREHLKGYVTQELIDLCCKQFIKGKRTEFVVEWES